ncbi:MAG TPA: hypothetical protein VLF60_01780 [Candidatus Saccharimonadales bacterium]|nr:hypothetical protein [Candidatus Saccharimonadales bacterium]
MSAVIIFGEGYDSETMSAGLFFAFVEYIEHEAHDPDLKQMLHDTVEAQLEWLVISKLPSGQRRDLLEVLIKCLPDALIAVLAPEVRNDPEKHRLYEERAMRVKHSAQAAYDTEFGASASAGEQRQ